MLLSANNTSGSVVIVSHSYTMLKQICDRIMVLDTGSVVCLDSAEKVIEVYQKMLQL